MKNPSKNNRAGKNKSANGSAVALLLAAVLGVAVVLWILYLITGCVPLLLAAVLTALPAVSQIPLLIPFSKLGKPNPEGERFGQRWGTSLKAAAVVLTVVLVNVLYWLSSGKAVEAQEGYYVPVILAVLLVVCVIAEKWSKHTAENLPEHTAAMVYNLSSALWITRWVLIMLIAATVVRLMGVWEPESVLKVLLAGVFIYVTCRLLWSVVQRLMRRELDTKPDLSLNLFGARKEDTDLLTYMEENTGITMRSLWSLRFIGQLLPAAIMGVALVLWLSTGIVLVDSNQEGALYRAGKLQPETLEPGLHFTLPWPIDRVEIYDTQSVGSLTIGYIPEGDADNLWTEDHGLEEYRLLLGSGDEMVSINLKVQYKIDNLYDYVSSSAAPESLLQAKAYEVVTERTIVSDLETLLSVDRKAFAESFRQELAEKIATHRTGLQVTDVVLESIHPPVEIAPIYQKIISAGIAADQLIINAENSANQSIKTAEKTAITSVGDARVAQYKAIAEAKAAVAEFMASVAADTAYRDEYRYYKYMNALMEAYNNAKLIIVGEGIDTSNLYIGSWNAGSDTQDSTN